MPRKLLFRWLLQRRLAHRTKKKYRDKTRQGLKKFDILKRTA